jgi:amidase
MISSFPPEVSAGTVPEPVASDKEGSVRRLLYPLLLLPPLVFAAEPPGDAYQSIAEWRAKLASGAITVPALTDLYLHRIATIDPKINAVIEVNPDARAISHTASANTPLAGIPILLKDNIDTGDRMLTTAGSFALAGQPASQDAGVAARLRAAGAIILGKTNLSEWANFRSSHAVSGWSARGGQTHNPYVLDRNPCGSSSGSAVAVAAGLAVAAIGTETDGSILCPAAANGIVGLKPTLGLVSRAGIVPISHSQDTAGPMARSVADAAALLSVIAGSDERDPATADADAHAADYTKFLDPHGLKGKRIGVLRSLMGREPNADRAVEEAIAVMRAQGAIIVDPVELPHVKELSEPEEIVLDYDFKTDIEAYLATRPGAPKSLAGLIAFNRQDPREMPWFGQDLFEASDARGPLTDAPYRTALAKAKRLAGPEGIDRALSRYKLDALLGPSAAPACVIDPVLGDNFVGGSSGPAAVAGYPSITVPAGYAHELPLGITLLGAKWSEPTLIAIAYGFERAGPARHAPRFLSTVPAP